MDERKSIPVEVYLEMVRKNPRRYKAMLRADKLMKKRQKMNERKQSLKQLWVFLLWLVMLLGKVKRWAVHLAKSVG